MKAAMNINIPVTIFKEGKAYIAYSPVLDISTSATTYQKVQKRFADVVDIFFEELVAMGTLDEVLRNLGWNRTDHAWNPPLAISHEMTTINVPLRN